MRKGEEGTVAQRKTGGLRGKTAGAAIQVSGQRMPTGWPCLGRASRD